MLDTSELNLTPEKKKKYDSLLAEMMEELEVELEKVPKPQKNQLDGPRGKVYREIEKKYLPRIREIIEAPE